MSFTHWFEGPSLFHSSPSLKVHATPVSTLTEEDAAAHPLQQFKKTWTVSSSDVKALTRLRLVTPGLTIVRVNPQLRQQTTETTFARIHATSDTSQHIHCMRVSSKRKNKLCVVFKNATDGESESDMGSLVTEIELADATQICEILAMGGGDVTVDGGVLINDVHHGVLLVALHETRLRVNESQTPHLQLKELLLGSAGSGEVYVIANELMVLRTFDCGVLGDGRIHVVAAHVTVKSTQVAVVGEFGTVQVRASSGLATEDLTGYALGSGYVSIQSSPLVEMRRHTTCTKQDLHVEGSGRIDVAGVPSERVRIKMREGGRVVAQPRQHLELDCCIDSAVECIGVLPPAVVTTSQFRMNTIVVISYNDRILQQRIAHSVAPMATIPPAPSVASVFDTPQWLHVTKTGFRSTFLRPFFELL